MEQAKGDHFGHYFFVSDALNAKVLKNSVVSISKDGTNHCEVLKGIFALTSGLMRVIQCDRSLFQFLPNKERKNVDVHRIDNITGSDKIKR